MYTVGFNVAFQPPSSWAFPGICYRSLFKLHSLPSFLQRHRACQTHCSRYTLTRSHISFSQILYPRCCGMLARTRPLRYHSRLWQQKNLNFICITVCSLKAPIEMLAQLCLKISFKLMRKINECCIAMHNGARSTGLKRYRTSVIKGCRIVAVLM